MNSFNEQPPQAATSAKKKLLVIPKAFPAHPRDIHGVFLLDYIESVKPYCTVNVLHLKIFGENSGLRIDQENGATIYRYCLTKSNRFFKLLKPLLYLLLWLKGKSIIKTHLNNFDLIHVHGTVFYAWLAIGAAKKKPVVLTEHSRISKIQKKKIFYALAKYIISRVTCLLTVSEDLKTQFITAKLIPRKFFVTYNPVNTDLFKPLQNKVEPAPKNIIFVARLEEYKGGLKVCKAFINLFEKYPDWKLILVGTGPELENITQLKNSHSKASEAILIRTQLTKAEIAEEMKHSSFFIMPSEHETFGIVIAEAMSCGLPVIVGNLSAPKEFVDSECGILINPESEEEIMKAMDQMIQNYKKYDGKKIRQKVVDKFGFVSFGKKINAIYGTALNESKTKIGQLPK